MTVLFFEKSLFKIKVNFEKIYTEHNLSLFIGFIKGIC